MQDGINAMKTALRVLTAVTKMQNPEPADLDELRRLAPSLADSPIDELACAVIQQAIKRREAIRERIPGGLG
jgi:hypothetical protein